MRRFEGGPHVLGSHAIVAARVGTYRESEAKLAEELLQDLDPGMLLLADCGFSSCARWRKIRAEPDGSSNRGESAVVYGAPCTGDVGAGEQ